MTMSVLELANVRTTDGNAFASALEAALAVLRQQPACLGAEAHRCIERPDEFVVLVEWTSVEAHEEFRASENFQSYREPIGGLLDGHPSYAHFDPSDGASAAAGEPAAELARELFAAVESNDAEAILDLYAEAAEIRSNVADGPAGPDDVVAAAAAIAAAVPDFAYEELSCEPTPSGFVRQHLLRGTASDGERFAVASCCVGIVAEGRVTRLDEYVDAAAFAALGL